jgi:hypothetical protein
MLCDARVAPIRVRAILVLLNVADRKGALATQKDKQKDDHRT